MAEGAGPTRRGRSRRVALGVVCVVVAALVALAVAAPRLLDRAPGAGAVPEPLRAHPVIADLPAAAPVPDRAAVARLLEPLAADPALGQLSGRVSDAATGQVLWQQDPATRLVPASTTKVLTATAALLALPLDSTVRTAVVAGAQAGHVVLVGGGDITLSAQPAGQPSYFQDAPRVDDLVAQLRRSGVRVTSVSVDTSAYQGPLLARGWDPVDIAGGFIAPMQPVMLDGGRLDPLQVESPRSEEPALDAGRALAQRLGLDPQDVRGGAAPAGARVLASVDSAPLRVWLEELTVDSDNLLAEAVGRRVAAAAGRPASFDGATAAVLATLRGAGFDVGGVVLEDLSGMSVDNRVTAAVLDSLLLAAARPVDGQARPDPAVLRPLLDFLPVAGGTGTLAARYQEDRRGAGWVRAKTGTLTGVSTLAGYLATRDGRVLTFALMSQDSLPSQARPALDAIAAALQGCGCP